MRWIFVLFLAACGGSVAPSSDDTPAVVDAGADADVCAERTVEAWCEIVARVRYQVDPRADGCCTRWLDVRSDASTR